MERDNGKQILEKNLFHGTQKNVVEAICRTNFDWRLCGSHGTMYGQGKGKANKKFFCLCKICFQICNIFLTNSKCFITYKRMFFS